MGNPNKETIDFVKYSRKNYGNAIANIIVSVMVIAFIAVFVYGAYKLLHDIPSHPIIR